MLNDLLSDSQADSHDSCLPSLIHTQRFKPRKIKAL